MEVNRDVKAADYKSDGQFSRSGSRDRFVRDRVRLVGVGGDIRRPCLSKWRQPGRWLLVVVEMPQVGETILINLFFWACSSSLEVYETGSVKLRLRVFNCSGN